MLGTHQSWFFIDRLKACSRPHLLITAKYDLTFKPELTEKVLHQYQNHNIRTSGLPCPAVTTPSLLFHSAT